MKSITADELKKRLADDDISLIDVREPIEHKNMCIYGAHLIPLDEISIEKLPTTKKTIILHCKSGKRSRAAGAKLLSMDPSLDIFLLDGGITAWEQAGYTVKRTGSTLSLERQTQIVVGCLALSGTILGTFINPKLYIIPGFIGAGLMFAGITGWCGMAKLLAKMPWNK